MLDARSELLRRTTLLIVVSIHINGGLALVTISSVSLAQQSFAIRRRLAGRALRSRVASGGGRRRSKLSEAGLAQLLEVLAVRMTLAEGEKYRAGGGQQTGWTERCSRHRAARQPDPI